MYIMHRTHRAQWLLAFAGLWTIASPYVLPLFGPAGYTVLPGAWTFVVVGAIALGIVALEYLEYETWQDWSGVMLGVGTLGAPWYVGFASSGAARLDALFCGTVILLACFWSLYIPDRA